MISRECHLRRAAREFIDLVFSSSTPTVTTRGDLVSRVRDLRRAAREVVDLVFSSSTPRGIDAAISFLVFEIFDVPHESSSISCSRRPMRLGSVRDFRYRARCTGCRTASNSRLERRARGVTESTTPTQFCPVARSTVFGPFVTIWYKRYGGPFYGAGSTMLGTDDETVIEEAPDPP